MVLYHPHQVQPDEPDRRTQITSAMMAASEGVSPSNLPMLMPKMDTAPRWYDALLRFSYGLSLFKEFKKESSVLLPEVLRDDLGRRRFGDFGADKTQLLLPEQLFALYQQQSSRRRWYDQIPVMKRYMMQLIPMDVQEKLLVGDKFLAMSLLTYQYYIQPRNSLLVIPNDSELMRLMRGVYNSNAPLMALESVYQDDLASIMKKHLQHRQLLQTNQQGGDETIHLRYVKKTITIAEMLRPFH